MGRDEVVSQAVVTGVAPSAPALADVYVHDGFPDVTAS
jgi:hypothetical protein